MRVTRETAFSPNTDFGINIRKKLLEHNRTQEWLINNVKDKTGLYFDSSYLHKIMAGKTSPPKIISTICEILEI